MDRFGDVSCVGSKKARWHNWHVSGTILSRTPNTSKVEFARIRYFSESLAVDYR
jgi:hypothetical protein